MKLDAVLNSPATAWMAMERRVNDGSPSGITTTTSTGTSPTGPSPHFQLPFYRCDLTVIGEPLPTGGKVPDGFPTHPDITDAADVGLGADIEPDALVPVVPTASGRTVALAKAPDRVHLKLHYPGTLGRFSRRLDHRRAEAAVNNSTLLVDQRANLGPSAGLLPEPTALISPNGAAAVIRLPIPHPRATNEAGVIPMFSLWSTDQDRPDDPNLLAQLLQATTADPIDVLYHQLLEPIVDTWLGVGLELGLWCEWNAQNLLVTIDDNGTIQRIIFRDLQGLHRDPAGRPDWAERLPTRSHRTFGQDPHLDRQQRSWLFDFKLGEYVLDPLLNHPALTPTQRDQLTSALRSRVDQRIAQADIFPPGASTWGQPPGPTRDGRWIAERPTPPRYRTATPKRFA